MDLKLNSKKLKRNLNSILKSTLSLIVFNLRLGFVTDIFCFTKVVNKINYNVDVTIHFM